MLTKTPDCLRALYRAMGLVEAKRPGLAPRRRDAPACEEVGRLRD